MNWKLKKPLIPYSDTDRLYDKLCKIYGITDLSRFLDPPSSDLNDPYDLKNIEPAIKRITNAINDKEKITLFPDCDPDGCTSGAIMYRYLRNFTKNVDYIFGSRLKGHGLHTVIDKIPEDTNLLIVMDSSSENWKECKELKNKGVDVIVIDHHVVTTKNYYCILVNPQQDDCCYPNKNISGAALTWKVCQAIDEKLNTNKSDDLCDLAAVGLLSDMMSMMEPENRAIVNRGLGDILNVGLLAILKAKNKNPKYISSTDVVFSITPLLNAAARLDRIDLVIDLLLTDDQNEAKEIVNQIDSLNNERKIEQASHYNRIKSKILYYDNIIIVFDDEVSKSYSGLIAGEIANEYKKPCLILSKNNATFNGSYRSYAGFDLKSFFDTLAETNGTGGHATAGGVFVEEEKIDDFINSVLDGLRDIEFQSENEYVLEFNADQINEQLIKNINYFYRINGIDIPEGQFLFKGFFVDDKQLIGKNQDTVKIECGDTYLMKFRTNKEFYDSIPLLSTIDVIGKPNLNYDFRLKQLVKQIYIEDYREAVD